MLTGIWTSTFHANQTSSYSEIWYCKKIEQGGTLFAMDGRGLAGNGGPTVQGAEEALGPRPHCRWQPGGEERHGSDWIGGGGADPTDGSGVAVGTRWGWWLLDPWRGTAVARGQLQVVASSI